MAQRYITGLYHTHTFLFRVKYWAWAYRICQSTSRLENLVSLPLASAFGAKEVAFKFLFIIHSSEESLLFFYEIFFLLFPYFHF